VIGDNYRQRQFKATSTDIGLLIAESNQKNEGAVGHCGSQAKNVERHPQASANSAQFEHTAADNKNFQGEFGQTIPIAQTSAAAIDGCVHFTKSS
jgi:hypothetical protein